MNINYVLKEEGVCIIEKLDTLKTNAIANSIATKLCNAFPEHGFDKKELFISLSRLDMYIADMPDGLSMAKYFSENNSIYFNKNLDAKDLDTIALHECIHYLQENKNEFNLSNRLGLATFGKKHTGVALNEAAVQLMTCEANNVKEDVVTYYNITLPTSSPTYYALQCVLAKQLAYFTGTYPLYHSTLFSNDIFKNTLISKTSKKLFNIIQTNFDKLVELEDTLFAFSNELQISTNGLSRVKSINSNIASIKRDIFNVFFKTQNIIMTNCFNYEFRNIKTLEELKNFKSRVYSFQHIIGTNSEYTFYKDFFYYTMGKLEQKEVYLEKHGYILTNSATTGALALFETKESAFAFMKRFIHKLKKLYGIGQTQREL